MQLKKVLAIVLSVVMLIAVMPFAAFATGGFTVGENHYATIAEAYAACQPGQTITLLEDVTGPVQFNRRTDSTITKDDVFTLDLNGHSIIAPSGQHALMLCMKHQLVIADSSEGHTGLIEASGNGQAIYLGYKVGSNYNLGKLTITGGTIRAVARAIYNPSSTCRIVIDGEYVNIVSTNVDAIGINKSSAALEIHKGTINGKENGVYVYTSNEVTIDGGQISGDKAAYIKTASTLEISGGTFEGTTSAIDYRGTKTGFISGGTFSDDVSEYVATGYTGVKDGAGNYVVASTAGYEAKVDGVLYETLEAAIAAAGTGATVTLLADITVASPVVIAAGKDIKLDINGHSLSGNIADADGKKLVQVSGKLEFVGNNGGCIYNTNVAGQGHAACQALTGGTVIVNSPIHFGDSDTDMTNANEVNRGCGIQNNGGTLIINDGYYTAIDANYTTGAWAYAILNCEGDTTVNNATVYGLGLHGALGCEEGTFTVNGGNFAVNGANNYYSLYCDGGAFIVNGGTFTDNSKYGVNYVGTNSSTTIYGGDFTYSSTTPFVQSSSKANPVVSGGTFSSVIPAACCAPCYEPVTEPNAQGKYEVHQFKANDGANITVDDTISQNFYLDDDFYGAGAYVAIEYNHNSNASSTTDVRTDVQALNTLPELNDGGKYDGNRIFSVMQAPAQATEPIIINVYANQADAEAGTNPVKTIEYNTYTYCHEIIANYEGEDAAVVKELAESTLDYCAAAQTYFGYNTDDMATKDNAGNAFYNVVEDADLTDVEGILSKPATVKSASLVVKSDLEINLISVSPISITGTPNFEVAQGGDRFTASTYQNGSYYVLKIAGIEPANMNKTITVPTSEGTAVLTANAIMKLMSNHSNANLATLAKAMYLYGQAANAYFA